MMQLRVNEEAVQIVQQLFFDESNNLIGVYYTKKIKYIKKSIDSGGNSEEIGAYTITKIHNTIVERVIIECLKDMSYITPYFLTKEELIKLKDSLIKNNKHLTLRAEEWLRVHLQENSSILENDENLEENLIAYAKNELKFLNISNTINYSSRGILNSEEYINMCQEIINDEEQILMHIAYYTVLCYNKPELIESIFYKFIDSAPAEFVRDIRMEIFDELNINEGLYLLIQEYGIKNLRENYIAVEIYELIKQKLKDLDVNE